MKIISLTAGAIALTMAQAVLAQDDDLEVTLEVLDDVSDIEAVILDIREDSDVRFEEDVRLEEDERASDAGESDRRETDEGSLDDRIEGEDLLGDAVDGRNEEGDEFVERFEHDAEEEGERDFPEEHDGLDGEHDGLDGELEGDGAAVDQIEDSVSD